MSEEDHRITAVAEAFSRDLVSSSGILLVSCTCDSCLRDWARVAVLALDEYRENLPPHNESNERI